VVVCLVKRLGVIDYADALQIQGQTVEARKAGSIPDTMLLLEHPHVYTLGRNANKANLLISAKHLANLGVKVFETNRGGDITYHGPGQLVGYPILDLTRHRRDISWYMRSLEDVFIQVAAGYGIEATRNQGLPGVWVGNDKLVALGVHVSRWVTSHGFAFNIDTDLRYFEWIVPCGLRNKGVTSLEKLLGRRPERDGVVQRVIHAFGRVFALQMQTGTSVPVTPLVY
jgi:lipoyl(octanoyl) transferase